ncbi:YtxH domain-containing protein [Patescibacteria group bacterium]|nr:YtxH domain-containing protein [bacterium]MBU4298687.1 YtxH domain-containing protein [Patescibacteria group bacterium]MBU4481321.1 YtxH domain-containing protein [Patescibacteria group bacterium]
MAEEKKTKMNSVKKIITAGILGIVAGAIAGVLLTPKAGKALRKDLKKVYLKISQEVVKDAKKMKNLTQEGYEELVDKISDVYRKAKKVKDEDLEEIVKDLKKRWSEIAKKLKKE